MPTVPRPRAPRALVHGKLGMRPARADGTPLGDPAASEAVVGCAAYIDGCPQPSHGGWRDAARIVDDEDTGFVWIGLYEPSIAEFADIAEHFGLHHLAVEDAVNAHQRPKLELYEDMMFAVLRTVHYDDTLPAGTAEVVETGEVMVFVTPTAVITVRHGEHTALGSVRERLEAEPELLRLGPSAVLHAVLDTVVDSYVVVCRALQEDIDEAETAVFTATSKITDSAAIYALKREALELRRATAPLAPVLRTLWQDDLALVQPRVRDYFRDVDDHLTEVVDRVNGFDELLTSLVAANLARVSVVQNEDMRKISAWVAIAAVPTMLAGIYGMNFDHMPELHWSFGYPLLLLVMVTCCGGLYRAFKRNGWL